MASYDAVASDLAPAGSRFNLDLGVDLRVFAGGGIGKYLVKTNNSQWQVLATDERSDHGEDSNGVECGLAVPAFRGR